MKEHQEDPDYITILHLCPVLVLEDSARPISNLRLSISGNLTEWIGGKWDLHGRSTAGKGLLLPPSPSPICPRVPLHPRNNTYPTLSDTYTPKSIICPCDPGTSESAIQPYDALCVRIWNVSLHNIHLPDLRN